MMWKNVLKIINSKSDDVEECIEDKVKQIGNSEYCEASKQCKSMKKYTESLCFRERNDMPEWYF